MENKKTITTALLAMLLLVFMANAEIILQQSPQENTITNNGTIIIDEFEVNYYRLSNDFLISAKTRSVALCSCETYKDIITIKNTGTQYQTYTIQTNNPYSKLSLNTFGLTPNSTIEIINYLTPPCEKEVEKTYSIIVTNNKEKSLELKQDFTMQTCQNLILEPIKTKAQINPCQEAEIKVKVRNIGLTTDEYQINVKSKETGFYTNISPQKFILNASQEKNITIKISPDCRLYGEKTLEIEAETAKTGLKASLPILLNISKNYDYTVEAPNSINTCKNTQNEIDISIKNNANLTNNYELSLKNQASLFQSPIASLSAQKITLNASEQKNMRLIINKNYKGTDRKIILTVKSEYGNIIKEIPINVTVENCYDFEISADNLKITNENRYINYTIKNKGTKPITVNTSVGYEFGLEPKNALTTTIAPNSAFTNTFTLSPYMPDKKEKYGFVAWAYSYDSGVSKQKVFYIRIIPKKEYYNTIINAPLNYFVYQKNQTISFEITNRGKENSRYYVKINGPEFIRPKEFFINQTTAGETKKITLNSNPKDDTIESDYPMNITVEVIGTGVNFEKTTKIVYNKKTMNEKIIDFIKKCANNTKTFFGKIKNAITSKIVMIILGMLLLILLIILAIILIKNFHKKEKRVLITKPKKRRNIVGRR